MTITTAASGGGADGDIGTLYTTMRNALRGGWKLIEVYDEEDDMLVSR